MIKLENLKILKKEFIKKKKLKRKYFRKFQIKNKEIVIKHYKEKVCSIFTNFFLFSIWIELLNLKN